MDHSTHAAWTIGIDREVAWWCRYLASGGLGDEAGFRFRFDPNAPLQPDIAALLPEGADASTLSILDCAAGPATTLGKTLRGVRLPLTAIDALAEKYMAILAELGLVPPVRTQMCEVEHLDRRFPPDTFALVYMRFALDHCYAPLTALRQMVRVARPGAAVLVEHYRDPSQTAHEGLRHWDLHPSDDDLVVSTEGRQFSVRDELEGASISMDVSPNWFTMVLRKTPPGA
jgi:ubiquinone/menaquinone biosynthesis C-methylase UbiE